jgi:hypothetical protein
MMFVLIEFLKISTVLYFDNYELFEVSPVRTERVSTSDHLALKFMCFPSDYNYSLLLNKGSYRAKRLYSVDSRLSVASIKLSERSEGIVSFIKSSLKL